MPLASQDTTQVYGFAAALVMSPQVALLSHV